MRSSIKILLILLGFVSILYVNSNFVDPDLGWHLRFGKDFSENRFSYTDTYTWGYSGKPWINHEWGGDIFLYQVYTRLGYLPLLVLMSALPWAAFLLAARVFERRTTLTSVAVALFAAWSVHHIFVVRLSMFSPFFLALLLWSLERLPRKTYYFWPALFWIWSALHGSWVLGFIVIGMYVIGNTITLLLRGGRPITRPSDEAIPCLTSWHYRPTGSLNFVRSFLARFARDDTKWPAKIIMRVLLWTVISLIVTLLNPYGIGLWKEILLYFTETYYKAHVTEWVPSYTYPIYWQTVALAGVAIAFFALALKKRKLTLPQTLLFVAFLLAGIKYKRNMLYFALVSAPLISMTLRAAYGSLLQAPKWKELFSSKKVQVVAGAFAAISLALLIAYHGLRVRLVNDVWADAALLRTYPMPVAAAQFLQQKIGGRNTPIFNEFAWGGYLNWVLPQAKIFFGGQGAATWRVSPHETLLEYYHRLIGKPGGLKEIETGPPRFILLAKNSNLPRPDAINKLIFSQEDLKSVLNPEPTDLEKDLTQSREWALVYEDDVVKIWERKMQSVKIKM